MAKMKRWLLLSFLFVGLSLVLFYFVFKGVGDDTLFFFDDGGTKISVSSSYMIKEISIDGNEKNIVNLHPETTNKVIQHTVMIGDSLTRYRFLSEIYQLHFSRSAPKDIISDVHKNWRAFYERTSSSSSSSSIFGKDTTMECDCFRAGRNQDSRLSTENRHYVHPESGDRFSFFWLAADRTIFAWILLSPRSIQNESW